MGVSPPCALEDSGKPTAESRVNAPVPANATNTAIGPSPLNPCDFPNTEHLKPKTLGEAEPIGTTSNHPFWSVDRQEFVQAGSLEIGERLQTLSGDVKVVQQKLPRPGPQPVFNLEVHNEHVYFVGEDGVLVHNACEFETVSSQGLDVFGGGLPNRRLFETLRGANLDPPNNFPRIDRINRSTRVGTSMKTMDLTSAVASDPKAFQRQIRGYFDKMHTFEGGTERFSSAVGDYVSVPILAGKRIELGVHAGQLQAWQRTILRNEARRAARWKIPVHLKVYELR